MAAGNLHAYESARGTADGLEATLDSRAVINRAKGVLSERYELTPDRRFRWSGTLVAPPIGLEPMTLRLAGRLCPPLPLHDRTYPLNCRFQFHWPP